MTGARSFTLMMVVCVVTVAVSSATIMPLCPDAPNCVSSLEADSHRIEPFPLVGSAGESFDRLREVLKRRSDTTIVSADAVVLRVEFRTLLGFVDDGLFILDEKNRAIQIRSASRAGYWDFGKNRRRLREIRRDYQYRLSED